MTDPDRNKNPTPKVPDETREEGFDFEAERARLRAMTAEELAEYAALWERTVIRRGTAQAEVWESISRLEMAQGEVRRRS
jgi:hypothetical protein